MFANYHRLNVCCALLISGGVWYAVAPQSTALPVISTTNDVSYPLARAGVVGSTSCSAASCHGGDGVRLTPGTEHTTWAAFDPHRNAYSVLFSDRSRRMVQRLKPNGKPAPPHRNALCLSCHGASPPNLSAPLANDNPVHRFASCENCHGAAEHWLTVHYTPAWKGLPSSQKAEQYGLVSTKDYSSRAQTCAGCHIGEPGREVDHRLIAAGHPALRFEFAAYQSEPVYTKHWCEKQYGVDSEAWAWLIGQAATARASTRLLEHRTNPTLQREWPELAEYACFSCHRELTPGSVRTLPQRRDPRTTPRPGAIPWGSWAFPLALDLVSRTEFPGEKSPLKHASALMELFRTSDRPTAGVAHTAARAAIPDFDGWANRLDAEACRRSRNDPLRSAELRQLLTHVLQFGERIRETGTVGTDWDRHTQAYLGVAALYRALCTVEPASRDPKAEALLRTLAADLQFAPGKDGPVRWSTDDEQRFQTRWRELRTLLEARRQP